MKLNTGAKEIQQVNSGGHDNSQSIKTLSPVMKQRATKYY